MVLSCGVTERNGSIIHTDPPHSSGLTLKTRILMLIIHINSADPTFNSGPCKQLKVTQ